MIKAKRRTGMARVVFYANNNRSRISSIIFEPYRNTDGTLVKPSKSSYHKVDMKLDNQQINPIEIVKDIECLVEYSK